MWVFGGEEGFLRVAVPALVCGSAASDAAVGVGGGGVAADAADVNEHGLVFAEEEGQTLGYRLLSDALVAVDEYQRCRGWVHGPAEDIRGRNGGGDGRTAVGQPDHWDGVGSPPQYVMF